MNTLYREFDKTVATRITDPLVHLLQNHVTAETDILELRHGLELVAAHYAALRATAADRQQIRRVHEQLNRTLAKGDITPALDPAD